MNVSLSLWLALLVSSFCGNARNEEEESTTVYYDYVTEMTSDYDYNATFDYYYVTGQYDSELRNKAKGIGQMSPVLLLGLAVHHIWT